MEKDISKIVSVLSGMENFSQKGSFKKSYLFDFWPEFIKVNFSTKENLHTAYFTVFWNILLPIMTYFDFRGNKSDLTVHIRVLSVQIGA